MYNSVTLSTFVMLCSFPQCPCLDFSPPPLPDPLQHSMNGHSALLPVPGKHRPAHCRATRFLQNICLRGVRIFVLLCLSYFTWHLRGWSGSYHASELGSFLRAECPSVVCLCPPCSSVLLSKGHFHRWVAVKEAAVSLGIQVSV